MQTKYIALTETSILSLPYFEIFNVEIKEIMYGFNTKALESRSLSSPKIHTLLNITFFEYIIFAAIGR